MTLASESPLRRALYRALHDPLTGLANRGLLMEQLGQALARARRRPGSVAVLFLDLDRFKVVNDSLGHATGDDLLVEVARRLERVMRSADMVARLGGDEFVILAEDVAGVDEAFALARRLREAVAAPMPVGAGQRVVITASVGIALSAPGPRTNGANGTNDDGDGDGGGAAGSGVVATPSSLLWDADVAMYRAKDSGRDRVQLFEDGLRADSLGRFRSEAMLRHALDHDGLRLHYQPLIDLDTGALAGAEALVRLHDPDRGLILPAEFIPVAEETGLVVPLGAWVVAEAAAQAAAWQALQSMDAPPMTVSVNLSGRQLSTPGFAVEVGAAIARSGADAAHLCFEVTEHTLLDASGVTVATLEALKELGVRLAIDDFGTGHSSLTWLRRLPADFLKVDRTFVAGLGTDPGDTAIVRAVLDLGAALGLTTVAEGVETPAQLAALRDLGCDWAQGFHLARPGPPETVTTLLKEGTRW
ncbi:MAG TPA: bifunctional diguanylate cyclase/phosphodiesterase [Acidimicrobiia bacterium]|nr:bifunctional diguanylate cyclase/phosphodiesterase [Acidimicrobiia bacterium]